jgi:hypothetical protein
VRAKDPTGFLRLVHAGDHDANAVRRRADAAAFIATDLPRCAYSGAARHTYLTRWLTENLDATAAKWCADTAAFVAAILSPTTEIWTTRLTRWLLRRAVLVRADLTEAYTLAAAFIAAILPRSAHDLVARLADAKIFGARQVIGDADTTALRATGRPLDAENCRARVVVDRLADSRAVGPASGGITTVARIVDALESVGTRKSGQPAAHPARSRDLRGAPS